MSYVAKLLNGWNLYGAHKLRFVVTITAKKGNSVD